MIKSVGLIFLIVIVSEYNGNFYSEIRTKINDEKLDLRFAIVKLDFELLKLVEQKLHENDKFIFKGVYLNNSDFQELGIMRKQL